MYRFGVDKRVGLFSSLPNDGVAQISQMASLLTIYTNNTDNYSTIHFFFFPDHPFILSSLYDFHSLRASLKREFEKEKNKK